LSSVLKSKIRFSLPKGYSDPDAHVTKNPDNETSNVPFVLITPVYLYIAFIGQSDRFRFGVE
jgi:hypothetical protein